MSPRRRAWILAAAAAVLLGSWAVYTWGLTWAGLALLDPAPLCVATPSAREPITRDTWRRLDAGGEVRLDSAQLNGLVDPDVSVDVDAFDVRIDGSVATVDAAIYAHRMAQRWANIHAQVEAEVSEGRFTHARVHTLQVSGRELAGWLGEGDVAETLNSRVHWIPDLERILAEVEHASIADGGVTVQLKPGSSERL